VNLWLNYFEDGYIIVFFISLFVYMINHMLLIPYYITLYCTGLKYLWPVQFIRFKTIGPAAQPVHNGWTSEPVNR
jgi:hypothetical protein